MRTDFDCPTREDLVADGIIIPRPDIHDQISDGVPGPWAPNWPTLKLDRTGRDWAKQDIAETVQQDYRGYPPSHAAARIIMRL